MIFKTIIGALVCWNQNILKINEYLFFITFLWQKLLVPPKGVKPNASHFPC